jgi:hypothetical protein
MVKILLVPGYATRLHVPIFRPRGLCEDLGFTGFRDRLKNGDCALVDWGLEQHVSWWNLLNPWTYYRAYRAEERYMLTDAPLQKLRHDILQHTPRIIVAHSMGARLLGRLLAQESFPFLEEVHFVLSDDHRSAQSILGNPQVFHHYCPWDSTLALSSLIHWQWRAGFLPSLRKDRKNLLVWLIRPFNLHTAPLRSPGFARKVAHIYAVRSPRD